MLGTFWPYSADKNAKLNSVVASQRRVLVQRTALNLREMLEANVSAEAIVSEVGTNRYAATIAGFPVRSAEEMDQTNPPNSSEKLPEKGNIVLLKTSDGLKAVNIERIQDVTFKQDFRPGAPNEEFRNLLTLKLDWTGPAAKSAQVGLLYLQKGVRWIPSYKVTIDGKGEAVVKLQATILNELTDLEDAIVNLVIGVPTFAFKETIDPMALQQTAAQLSQYFRGDAANSPLAANFSNAIMSQSARVGEFRQGGEAGPGAGVPELPEGTRNEDLFVFTLKHITLKKGERVVVPVVEFTLPYKDVFTLDLPFAPPRELRGSINSAQQQELARLFSMPKVMHQLRLSNKSQYPLTTAPALIIRGAKVLSQGMMTYTAVGASSDLAITTAVDIQARKSDAETQPNFLADGVAMEIPQDHPREAGHLPRKRRERLGGTDCTANITLTNHRTEPVTVEIARHVLGNADKADHDGAVEKINVFENGDSGGSGEYPFWWNWYGWPAWWSYFNGVSRINWTVNLDPGKSLELGYAWHYFWN